MRHRRDLFVLPILIGAVALLIWNGTSFFETMKAAGEEFTDDLKIASTTLTLNVALILFGWRYYVDVQQEVQRRAESEERAARIASTDGMTGLLNRKGLSEAGEEVRESARAAGRHATIISLRLNRFKSINDRHGYDVGDEVLRRIANGISEAAGEHARVARVAGDEFAILTTMAPDRRERIETLAQALLEIAIRPILIDEKLIHVGAFAGIAATPPEDLVIRDLLRRADIAQAEGRAGRIARPVWFDERMERELVAHGEIEQGIRVGLENEQFKPYFEPQVDLATGEVIGFEVLARWEHPLSGLIGPDRFIPVAEENGLIDELSDQVARQALAAAAEWEKPVDVSINISATQLNDSWLAQKIVRLLAETGFPAERLIIEITESSLFADPELARAITTSLKNQGVRVALDDFGTGYSSLAHLRALPFDRIKIDRSFTASLHRDRESEAIIRAVTTLAAAIDVPVTVEGVETARAHSALLQYGCQFGQGWFFGKPMSSDQAAQLVRKREPEARTEAPAKPAKRSRA
ncbi:putative bifunctional diguanylate cyclase/phosphodiesterase [Sphingomicrobium nitratireducens]|uniref:putative bifunctional diguanylate cyclase/phosphodiesterase n=1 Tax=Sphingomicrobium nitratireducens TaxID=2964666 RepID=UPI002240745B|nr:bifunctional diguanylate cyclase/phosphodiesterase [Sphingomicrobium nitratireducens]